MTVGFKERGQGTNQAETWPASWSMCVGSRRGRVGAEGTSGGTAIINSLKTQTGGA
jgi:hypothetical protein